jgi:hypothetical protein
VARAQKPYLVEHPERVDEIGTLVNLGGLVGVILLVALAYVATCALMRQAAGARRSLLPDFLPSLIPIAFVYLVAHYFSLFVIQGQFAIRLVSDPLGRGWDLFGTATFAPNLTLLSPQTTWYVQAIALVAGHVVGLAVAHDRAVAVFRERGAAVRSQYAMLALMVLYTVGGLWLLSRG